MIMGGSPQAVSLDRRQIATSPIRQHRVRMLITISPGGWTMEATSI
jgi:hypothetical protein